MFRRPSLHRPGPRLGTFLGELSLIVIGVLLALSVDEWRQNRARAAAGEEAIASIRAELATNRDLAIASRDYHQGRLAHIGRTLGAGEKLEPEDFPEGFTNPARFLDAAWETAREAGELVAVDRELRRQLAIAYSWQDRYEFQIESVSGLIYRELYDGGRAGLIGNPQGLMMLIGAFRYREEQIVGVFDETLAVIDAR